MRSLPRGVKPKPRIQRQLTFVVIAFALIPTLLVSSGLILHERHTVDQLTRQLLSQQSALAAKNLNQDLSRILEAMLHISRDHDVANSARSSTFSSYAETKIGRLLLGDEQAQFAAIVVNQEAEMVDAFPSEYLFTDISTIRDAVKQQLMQADRSNLSNLLVTFANGKQLFSADIAQQGQYVIFAQPLFFDSLADAPANSLTGALLLLIPAEYLITQTQSLIGNSELLSLQVEGQHLIKTAGFKHEKLVVDLVRQRVHDDITVELKIGQNRLLIDDQLRELIISLGTIVALILLLLLLVAIGYARHMARPFQQLRSLIAAYAGGDYYSKHPEAMFQEAQEVVEVLAEMAEHVIADHNQLEQRVNQRTQELEASNLELSATLKKLQEMQQHIIESEKMAQLGSLVAGVAHEINTPLGVSLTANSTLQEDIQMLSAMMKQKDVRRSDVIALLARILEAVEMVQRNLYRASELIRTFKEVSVDQTSDEKRTFKLYGYLHDLIASLGAELKRYNVTTDVRGDKQLSLDSFPGAFSHIFSNLIINSLRHGFTNQQQGNIEIRYHQTAEHFVLQYENDGAAASQDVLDKMFNPFFTTQRGQGGTGLGMHVVYNLVTQRLNGRIQVQQREQDNGIRFIIELPLSVIHQTDSAEEES